MLGFEVIVSKLILCNWHRKEIHLEILVDSSDIVSMKRIGALIALLLVFFSAQSVIGQNVSMQVKANSVLIEDAITLDQTKRLSFLIYDNMPLESGYSYEFGAIELVKPDGSRVLLQAARVQNGPIMHYSARTKLLSQSSAGFVLEMGPITRHNPDNTSEVLEISKKTRTIQFLPAEN